MNKREQKKAKREKKANKIHRNKYIPQKPATPRNIFRKEIAEWNKLLKNGFKNAPPNVKVKLRANLKKAATPKLKNKARRPRPYERTSKPPLNINWKKIHNNLGEEYKGGIYR